MPNALHYLALRELGLVNGAKFINHKRAVLDILEYEAAKPVHNQPCHFSGESRATFLVDFSPNMLLAASTHGDHTVRVTDIQKGKCTHILTGHPRTPWCVAFNPTSSDILASGCLGGEVRIWDLLGGGSEVLQNPSFGAVITSLAFHPSGQVLVFATVNCIYFWDWTKPTPFAVTNTAHEYERIRWLRFDPFGQYLFTGIANNTTVHGESASARNVIHMRRDNGPGESRRYDQARRRRYNRLIERYQAFRQRLNSTSDYPEYINPRSPVHEENLSLARQYAGHVTEATTMRTSEASLPQSSGRPEGPRSLRLRNFLTSSLRANMTTLDSLLGSQSASTQQPPESSSSSRLAGGEANASGAASTVAESASEVDRNARRRWGRYQPSFFTSDRNNNDRLGYDNNNNDYSQENPNLTAFPSGGPADHLPPMLPSSLPVTSSSSAFSPWVTGSSSTSSYPAGSDGLEHNEFEILPVEQEQEAAGTTGGSSFISNGGESSGSGRHLPYQDSQRRELQSLLRRYRTTLSVLSSSSSSHTSTTSSAGGLHAIETVGRHRATLSLGVSASSSSAASDTPNLSTDTSVVSSRLSVPVNSSSSIQVDNRPLYRRLLESGSNVSNISDSLRPECTYSLGDQTSVPITDRVSNALGNDESRSRISLSSSSITSTTCLPSSSSMSQDGEGEGFDRPVELTSLETFHPCSPQVPATSSSSSSFSSSSSPTSAMIGSTSGRAITRSDTPTPVMSLSSISSDGSRASSSALSGNNAVRQNSNTCSSSSSSSSSVLNIPKGSLLRTKLTETTVTTAAGEFPLSRSYRLNSSSNVVIHPAPAVLSSSSSNSDQSGVGSSRFTTRLGSVNGGSSDTILSSSSTSSSSDNVPLFPSRRRRYSATLQSGDAVHSRPAHSSETPGPGATVIDWSDRSRTRLRVGGDAATTRDAVTAAISVSSSSSSVTSSSSSLDGNSVLPVASPGQQPMASTAVSTASDPVAEVQERLQQAVQQLRDVQSRVQELTSSSTYSANLAHAASVTEYLEQRVSDLDRRISDLEQRVESSGYLLSTNSYYQSRLGQHRPVTSRLRFARGQGHHGSDDAPLSSVEPGLHRSLLGPRQRSSPRVMPYLPAMSSFRGPPSHRTLSFNPSSSSSAQPSSAPSSSSSSSVISGAGASAASLPLFISIQPHGERNEETAAEFSALAGDDAQGFRRRGGRAGGAGGGGAEDGDWRGLQRVHLHTDYSSSILDETINRPDDAMQHIMSRTIAGVFLSRDEQAVANNIVPQTHRIQRWEISQCIVPDISNAAENIVVEHCKLHNDASCDISRDGLALATFVPSHRGFPDDNILGVFSLRKESFGQCLYTKSFGPNAISVSISPANQYVMVGLAAKRCFFFAMPSQLVGQVYRLVRRKAGEKSMTHVTDLYHPCNRGHQGHISVNSGRWLPGVGEGIVYGTNRGDLHFCRPGPHKVPELDTPELRGMQMPDLSGPGWRLRSSVRSNMATQTGAVGVRRSSSTQTPDEELAGSSDNNSVYL